MLAPRDRGRSLELSGELTECLVMIKRAELTLDVGHAAVAQVAEEDEP